MDMPLESLLSLGITIKYIHSIPYTFIHQEGKRDTKK